MRQEEWVTRMARLAATDFGADWVINSDADEFWWPRGGTLKDVLGVVPERFGVVRGCWRHFLPRPDGRPVLRRADDRSACARRLFPETRRTIFHAHQKVAHRADPVVEVERGNHNALGVRSEPLRRWHPIEVLHFSFRSVEQLERKASVGWMRYAASEPDHAPDPARRAYREGGLDAVLSRRMRFRMRRSSEESPTARLAVDTRLRDALRTLRDPDGSFRLPDQAKVSRSRLRASPTRRRTRPRRPILAGIDGIVRAEQRVVALEARLAGLRRLPRR